MLVSVDWTMGMLGQSAIMLQTSVIIYQSYHVGRSWLVSIWVAGGISVCGHLLLGCVDITVVCLLHVTLGCLHVRLAVAHLGLASGHVELAVGHMGLASGPSKKPSWLAGWLAGSWLARVLSKL